MDTVLAGKVAIVTGAGRGIGRCHALALAEQGAAVLVNDVGGSDRGEGVDNGPAAEVAAEIVANGGRAVANSASVADWDGAKSVVDDALQAFGRVDILVNNAGISRFAPIDTMSRSDWEVTIGVNLTGTAALTHWLGAHWRSQGFEGGRAIVNTSSPAGTNPLAGSPAYCASKAAVAALTITSAAELADLGVRVNAIAPMARTRLTDAAPFIEELMRKPETGFDRAAPENVSPLVVYLASPQCRLTGRVLGVEGADVYLFDGWSANHHIHNDAQRWTIDGLAAAVGTLPVQDDGYMIFPGARMRAPQPSDEVLSAVDRGRL